MDKPPIIYVMLYVHYVVLEWFECVSSINQQFSMAMLNNQRVYTAKIGLRTIEIEALPIFLAWWIFPYVK